MNQEEMVAAITERVLKMLEQQVCVENGKAETPQGKKTKVLVLGGECPPEADTYECCLYTHEQYNNNITAFDRVILAKLDFCDLADIALGRNGSVVSDAVIRALLSDIEVQMPESALPHRQFRNITHSLLYRKLEEYTSTLLSFGVKLISTKPSVVTVEAKPPRHYTPPQAVPTGTALPNADKLITEDRARELAAKGGPVCLQRGFILTPSARDVFANARIEIITK